MPDEKTRADALRWYLTGAASAGAAQADPDASLGKYRSSTEESPLGISVASAISNVTILYAAGANGTGSGSLTASDANTLKWTPPGGSQGAGVAIADGETKIVEGGGATGPNEYLRVTRTSAAALSGTATVTLADVFNNTVGLDNVSSAEAVAGDDEIRCLCGRVEASLAILNIKAYLNVLGTAAVSDAGQLGASGAGTITTTGSFADWPDTGFCRIVQSGGALREIVYYSSRTDTVLTVPTDGRERMGTSAAAGANDDDIHAVPGVRIAQEFGQIAAAAFTGSGLDDATSGGAFKDQTNKTLRVQIDGTGTPDTFKWSNDGGSTWEAETVPITGGAQTLEAGITVTFAATTGHTLTDYWDIVATAQATDKTGAGEGSIPSLSWNTSIDATNGLNVGNLDTDEQVFLWVRRDVIPGHAASPSVLHDLAIDLDSA